MSTSTPPSSGTATAATAGALRALRATALLSVLGLAWQFLTAGQLFGDDGPETLHAAGAIVLHVLSGLAAVCAVLLWRRGGAPAWLPGLAAVVFVLTFVQAAVGGYDTLWVHVPGAMVLTVGAVWVLAWAFTRGRAGGQQLR